jgi:hypothetical protein
LQGRRRTDGAVEPPGLGEFNQLGIESGKKRAGDKDGLTQGKRMNLLGFFDGGDGKNIGAVIGQEGNDGRCVVAIGIGLDDGTEFNGGAAVLFEQNGVVTEVGAADVSLDGFEGAVLQTQGADLVEIGDGGADTSGGTKIPRSVLIFASHI